MAIVKENYGLFTVVDRGSKNGRIMDKIRPFVCYLQHEKVNMIYYCGYEKKMMIKTPIFSKKIPIQRQRETCSLDWKFTMVA